MNDRFYFWRSYWDALSKLPDDATRGVFVSAMCRCAFEGVEPDFGGDLMLDFAWSMVSSQIRESVEIGRRSSANGKEGGRGHRKGRPKKGTESTPLSTPLGTAKSTPESTPERDAESVRYSNVPYTDGAYADATAPPSVSNPMADGLARLRANPPSPPK